MPGGLLPTSISSTGGVNLSFAYDVDGNRVVKWPEGSSTPALRLYAGGLGPLVTIAEDGTPTALVYGPRGLIGLTTGGVRYSVISDYLQSPRFVLDDNASVAASYTFNAFGLITSSAGPATGFAPLLFTGHEYDLELGLYNFGARLYDPSIGRFLAPDPAAQYPSSYTYVGGHPTVLVDPTGQMSALAESSLDLLLATVLVVSIVATAGATTELVPLAAGAATAQWGATAGSAAAVATGATVGAVGGAVGNAAFQGLYYGVTTAPGAWNLSDFGKEVGAAAIAGAVGGAITGGLSAPMVVAGAEAARAAAEAARVAEVAAAAAASTPETMSVRAMGMFADDANAIAGAAPHTDPSPATGSDIAERAGAPARAESSAAQAWWDRWSPTFKRAGIGGAFGAVGGGARGAIQVPLTNLIRGQRWDAGGFGNMGLHGGMGLGFGFVAGAIGGAMSAETVASIKSAFSANRVAWIASGSTVALGASWLLYLRSESMQTYGNN
jgi:RHS repeat-associated protein